MKSAITYSGYQPGALADVLKLHTDYYHEHWNFGLPFETKVASELAEFLCRMDKSNDLFILAYAADGQLLGSITIDAKKAASKTESDGAHLRWFIVSPESAGQGIGRELISRAISHCDDRNFSKIYLTTFAGLDAARNLYDQYGFKLESERSEDQWNGGVVEQGFVRLLASNL